MSLHKEDKPAAFIGLIATAVLLFVMALGLVEFTNAKYAGHKKAEATQTKH